MITIITWNFAQEQAEFIANIQNMGAVQIFNISDFHREMEDGDLMDSVRNSKCDQHFDVIYICSDYETF